VPLVEQLVQVLFSGVDQRTKDKVIRVPGKLVEAKNVRMSKTGAYGKRYGASALNTTTDSGTITTGKGIAASNDSIVLHANDVIYNRDTTNNMWRNRGTQARAFATDQVAIPSRAGRPQCVVQSGYIYEFTAGLQTTTTPGFYYRVTDAASGIEIKAPTFASYGGVGTTVLNMRAIAAGGYVWVFIGDNDPIKAFKFDPATPAAAPTSTDYFDPTAGGVQIAWDVISTVNGVAFFAIAGSGSTIGGVSRTTWFSYLDTATGLAAASPGWVGDSTMVYSSGHTAAWVKYDGTNGFLYLTYLGPSATFSARLVRVSASAFTGVTERNLTNHSGSNDRILNGYSDDGDTVQVLLSDASNGSTSADIENCKIHKYQHVWSTNTTTTTSNWMRHAWLACEPFKIGSTWYLITGYDDNNNLQRSYCLRTASDKAILARALYARAGNVFHRGTTSFNNMTAAYSAVTVSGNTVYSCLIGNDGVNGEYHVRRVIWNLADSYGPLRSLDGGQNVLVPGGWPARLGDSESTIVDPAPMMYPRSHGTPTTVASAGATLNGTYGVAILYSYTDGRGRRYLSSPTAQTNTAVTTNNAIRIAAPNLRMGNQDLAKFKIEVYITGAGPAGSLQLVKTVANDPTTDTQNIDLTAPAATGAETIYTASSELSNAPPPPFKVVTEWHNRVFLTDTDVEGEVWASKEYVVGRGTDYAETLVFKVGAGTGRIRAAGVVDDNYLAFFKRDSISVIQGAGPDSRGRGQYSPIEVPGAYGCTNPNSVVTGPQGCFFAHTDGGIYLLGRTLEVTYIGRGVDNHKSATIQAAVHFPKDQHVRFWTSTNKVLVFDYGHPTESDPMGQWYVWEGDAMAGLAAAVVNDVVHYVQSNGVVYKEVSGQYFDGTNTPILHAVEIAPIPFGNILGYSQCMRGQLLGTYAAASTVRVTLKSDYAASTDTLSKAFTAGPLNLEFRPVNTRKNTSFGVRIEQTGSDLTEAFTIEGLAFEILLEPRLRRLNTTARI